jgi:hypothetical protein
MRNVSNKSCRENHSIHFVIGIFFSNRGVHRVLAGKPEGKKPLGRSTRRWEDNIKMDLQEVGGGRGDWM